MADEAEKKPAGTGLEAAADRIRETAKWLVVTFGAIAGVLVGGLQLTSLPDLSDDVRSDALFGYGLGVAGALLAVLAATIVMTAGRRTLDDLTGTGGSRTLREHLNEMTDLHGGYTSIAELVQKITAARKERTQAWEALQGAGDATKAAEQAKYDAAIERMGILTPLANRLLTVASFEHLRRTWVVCRVVIVASAALSAAGVAIFAANAAQKEKDAPAPAVAAQAVPVRVSLTAAGKKVHGEALGATCVTTRIDGIATASTAESVVVQVVPTSDAPCSPVSLSLARGEATVAARKSVTLPDLTPEP